MYVYIVDNVSVDIGQMMKSKETAVTGLTKGIEYLFKKNGVTYLKGSGKITGAHEVSVVENGQKVDSKNIVIATGSEPTPLPGVAFDEKVIVSSTGALSFPSVPKKLLVIGAGVIGLELGSVWKRLGSEVTVVEFLDRIVPTVDDEVGRMLLQLLKKQGMEFHLGTKVTKTVVGSNGRAVVSVEPASAGGAGKPMNFDVDAVLVSIGRRPYTEGLGLKEAGVKLDTKGRVETDKNWRTNVPNIYAIGDVISGPMLAHKAEEEGVAIAETLAGKHGHVNYDAIPSVIYTYPEVASVGKSEEDCKKEGIKYKVGKFLMSANSRAKTNCMSKMILSYLIYIY